MDPANTTEAEAVRLRGPSTEHPLVLHSRVLVRRVLALMSHTETLDKSLERLVEWHRRGVSRNASSPNDGSMGDVPIDQDENERVSDLEHEVALDRYREEGAEHERELAMFTDAFRATFKSRNILKSHGRLDMHCICDAERDVVVEPSRPELLKTIGQLVEWYRNGPPPEPSTSHYETYQRMRRPGHHDPDDEREASDRDHEASVRYRASVDGYHEAGLELIQTLAKLDKAVTNAMRAMFVSCSARAAKNARLAMEAEVEAEAERIARLPEIRARQQKRAMERYDAHSAKIAMLRQIGRKDPVV